MYVARHVTQAIGHLRLSEVRPRHLQKVIDDALEAGLAIHSCPAGVSHPARRQGAGRPLGRSGRQPGRRC